MSFVAQHWVGLAWVSGLTALQSLPGTGALRTLFLLIGIVHLVTLIIRGRQPIWPAGRSEAVCLALLTVWLVVQSALLSASPEASLKALGGEWTKLLLMAGAGTLLAACSDHERNRAGWPTLGLFLGFFVHVVSTLGYQSWTWVRNGAPALGDSFLGNYGYVSPFVTGALAFLLAEVVVRLHGRRWLQFSNGALMGMLVATVTAQAMLTAKASLLIALLLFAVAAGAAVTVRRARRWAALIVLGGILTMIGSLAISDRWSGAFGSLSAAATTPSTDFRSLGKVDSSMPPLRSDGSFYERAVWAKIGLDGIGRHPMGLGYGSDAFGRYVTELGGPPGAVSSHSGWVDFGLANGIPGLTLLLALFFVIMWRSWCRWYREGSPAGLVALLVILNFLGRSVLDGNLAGSRFTGFAFVAAALWALAARPSRKIDDGRSD